MKLLVDFLRLKNIKMVDLRKITILAKEKGIALNDLAERAGISYQALNKITRTNSTKIETLVSIANALNVPPSVFLDDASGVRSIKTYPLIPIEAVAGFGTEDNKGIMYENCEQYLVPEFEAKGMDFLVRVSGSSMYPKYSNGDVLACKKIKEILFFQWGKVYVIDSSQGALVKRIFEDETNSDNIICVSENKEKYPPFKMPKSDIRSLSLVLGAIKLD